MQRVITFGCGHTESVHLVDTSQASQKTMQLLRRASCPACQRYSRYHAASRCAQQAGLLPLRSGCNGQLALAEIVRASLWRLLVPPDAPTSSCQLMAWLFNQHSSASFWLSLRGWTQHRLTPTQAMYVLLSLLHFTEKEKPYEQK